MAVDLKQNFDVSLLSTFFSDRAVEPIFLNQTKGGFIVTIGDSFIEQPDLDGTARFLPKSSIRARTGMMVLELGHRPSGCV